MISTLTNRLSSAFKVLKGHGKITEVNIGQTLKEVRRALIEADVSYKIANDFIKRVKQKALGEKVISSLEPRQLFIKIVQDELTELMGSKNQKLAIHANPSIILIAGLQGTGKTSFAGKLALELRQNHNKNPLLVACDVYRPAAIEQLKVLAERAEVGIYSDLDQKNPVKIASNSIRHAKHEKYNVVIIDTAGRLGIDEQMMNEISQIKKQIQPTETLYVVDAMVGQDAVNTAKAFNDVLDFDGVVLTKTDSEGRAGATLSVKAVVNKPIKYVAVGEKLQDLELFHPDRMASRILGMGDVVSLVEKSQQVFDQKEAQKIIRKVAKNKFDLDDMMVQFQGLKKMGGMSEVMKRLPLGNLPKESDNQEIEGFFDKTKHLYDSMTPTERANPNIINHSRKRRIAKGSGQDLETLNKLLKMHKQMGKMMKFGMANKTKVLKQLGGI